MDLHFSHLASSLLKMHIFILMIDGLIHISLNQCCDKQLTGT